MNPPTDTPTAISRRETLKRAAGALALGLGAPAAVAAAIADPGGEASLSFCSTVGNKQEPYLKLDIPIEVSQRLQRRNVFSYLKIGDEERGYTWFDVRPRRG